MLIICQRILSIFYEIDKQEALRESRPSPRPIGEMWNSLARRKAVYSKIFQDVPWPILKIRSCVFRNVANRKTRQTNRDENRTLAVQTR